MAFTKVCAALFLISSPFGCEATLQISRTLGDYAVLQRDSQAPPVTLWGFGPVGATVNCSMDGVIIGDQATIGSDGVWRIALPPMPADVGGGAGHTFLFSASDGSTASMSHVLFGEVWSCGGQSNMAFEIEQCNNATAEIAATDAYSSLFRVMTVGGEGNTPVAPAIDLNVTSQPWTPFNSTTAQHFSAVCWFTARDVYNALVAAGMGAIPFGLISNNVGGTAIELWSRAADLTSCANASAPYGPPYTNGTLYNGMIAPYTTGPTAMAGWLWYQAEANAPPYQHAPVWYACTFPALISRWRQELSDGDLPFIFVQLAPFNGTDGWEDIRQAQLSALSLPSVAYATMVDNGDPTSPYGTYHPRNKQLIGARLAAAALDIVYGMPSHWRAPELAGAIFTQTGTTATVTATFRPGSLSPHGLAVVPASCPTNETIAAAACADFSLFFQPAPSPNYTYLGAGFLAAGDDCGSGNYTVAQAQVECTANPVCVGFTFQADEANPDSAVAILFKQSVNYFAATGWQAYGSDRDVRGQRVAATAKLLPDGRSVVISAEGAIGQSVVAAGYGWATWPVTPLVDLGSSLPVIPWYALAPA